MTQTQPQMSVMLIALENFSILRQTLNALAAQTVCDQLEVIIAVPRQYAAQVESERLAPFWGFQIIELDGEITRGADAWAVAIPLAKAPIIVLGEDHCFPAPTWAEMLINAHQSSYAAVCPAMNNANPRTLSSWANFTLCFINWFMPDKAMPISDGPGHNTSYKREVLLQYGDDLATWLISERVMHYDLAAKGLQVYIEPKAVVNHINLSKLGAYLTHAFSGGRIFGQARAKRWSIVHKLVYIVASPLIPPLRLVRILAVLNTPAKRRAARFLPALPLILMGLMCHAAGEVMGYLTGEGNAPAVYQQFELRRRNFLLPEERANLWKV